MAAQRGIKNPASVTRFLWPGVLHKEASGMSYQSRARLLIKTWLGWNKQRSLALIRVVAPRTGRSSHIPLRDGRDVLLLKVWENSDLKGDLGKSSCKPGAQIRCRGVPPMQHRNTDSLVQQQRLPHICMGAPNFEAPLLATNHHYTKC